MERYVVRVSPTLPGVYGVWDTERRQWSLYVTQDQEDAASLCELWNALDDVWRRKGRAMGGRPAHTAVREAAATQELLQRFGDNGSGTRAGETEDNPQHDH